MTSTERISPPPPIAAGVLYIVGLPIGNLEDITFRAVRVLREVDVIAAEDTRHLEKYRRAFQIATPAFSLYDFNEVRRTEQLVSRLLGGQSVALVSDSGTPLVSDPGYRLVRGALEERITVTSVPGACAAITALTASGISPVEFRFVGFPPRTVERRRKWFARLRDDTATLIFYEAPHRLVATLGDLLATLGDRDICLARSLTKADEHYGRGSVSQIIEGLAGEARVRGEATVIVNASPQEIVQSAASHRSQLDMALHYVDDGLSTPEIVERLVGSAALSRREAYQLALKARQNSGELGS